MRVRHLLYAPALAPAQFLGDLGERVVLVPGGKHIRLEWDALARARQARLLGETMNGLGRTDRLVCGAVLGREMRVESHRGDSRRRYEIIVGICRKVWRARH